MKISKYFMWTMLIIWGIILFSCVGQVPTDPTPVKFWECLYLFLGIVVSVWISYEAGKESQQ